MKRCLVLVAALTLLLSQASAVVIPITLGPNPDGFFDTAKPCVDGTTNCRPPGPSVLACDDSAGPGLSGLPTGTPFSSNWRQFFSGSASATATLSVVTLSGTDATTNGWAVQSSGAGDDLINAGNNLGSGSFLVRGTTSGHDVDCPARNWSFVIPPSTDITPPTYVTGINADSVGSLSVTLSADAVMDPDDAVARSGVASYKFYRNSVLVDTLSAPSAGLVCDFAVTELGTGGGSATQGSGANGGTWSVASTAGYGVEGATHDSYNGAFCPVSGSSIYLIDRVDSIPNSKTYNKSHSDIRNVGTAGTEAHYDCVVLRVGSTYYMQRTKRPSDGGTNSSTGQVTLPGAPPYYRRTSVVGSNGSCDYSTDGGTWTAVFSADAITLNASKIAGVGASATSTGSDSAAITIPYGSVAVQTIGRVSKAVTVVAGTATFTMTATDVAGNERTAVGSVTATPTAPSSAETNLHAGHYMALDFNTSKANQLSQISSNCSSTALVGFKLYIAEAGLEGATAGDYTAGIAYLQDFVTAVRACSPAKYLMVEERQQIFGAPYSSPPTVGQLSGAYPAYYMTSSYGPCCGVNNGSGANLTYQYGAVIVAGAGSSNYPKSTLIDSYAAVGDRIIARNVAYGAVFDGQIETWSMGESADYFLGNVAGGDYSAKVTQNKRIIAAWATSWPHTQFRWQLNYLGNDSQMLDVLNYCLVHTNCVFGGPDPSLFRPTISALVVYKGTRCTGCTAHDFRTDGLLMIGETQDAGMGYSYAAPDGADAGTDPFAESTAAILIDDKTNFHTPMMVWWSGGYSSQYMLSTFPKVLAQLGVDHSVYALPCPPNFPGGCKTN